MTPEETLKVKSLTDPSDIFNYVVDHLRKQGDKSLHPDGGICAYRGRNENMCAVGCLIADDEYDPSLEGRGIVLLVEENQLPPGLKARIESSLDMLADLQYFHDSCLKYMDGKFTVEAEACINNFAAKWEIGPKA
jgi:hypothetical protein